MTSTRHFKGGSVRTGSARTRRAGQQGQALIYGLFVLVGGLAALFFLFNTGQLTREKTQLVNTADAVAYSAGVMNARALNHAAYTNRALIANEVAIAQVVSLSSWAQYVQTHADSTADLGCAVPQYAEPTAKAMVMYAPVCVGLYFANAYGVVEPAVQAVEQASEVVVMAAEAAKLALQAAQIATAAALPGMRQAVMEEVAQANYADDGEVHVDAVPLADAYLDFEGRPFMQRYSGDERERFKQATLGAAGLDPFIPARSWRSESSVPTCVDLGGVHNDRVERAGGTTLVGYDEWRALDTASIWRYRLRGRWAPRCRASEQALGEGAQAANTGDSEGDNGDAPGARTNPKATEQASSNDWRYSGLPAFFGLSTAARSRADGDPRLDFAVRVTRAADQTRTSDARAQVPASARLNRYAARPASSVYAGVSASQAYFSRPTPRADGNTELASLFNPYWQVRLIDASPYLGRAGALQGVVMP
jgi:hypothetical protein